jgi:hypothetical protein
MEERFTCYALFKRQLILCVVKLGNHAAGKKYTVNETCVRNWRNIKSKLFRCFTNIKPFSGPRNGRDPEIDARVLEHFKDYEIKITCN